jgi:hypothetical protein
MVRVREAPANFRIESAEILKVGHYGVKLRFETSKTPVDPVLSRLSHAGGIVDITISDLPLEEVIAKTYGQSHLESLIKVTPCQVTL